MDEFLPFSAWECLPFLGLFWVWNILCESFGILIVTVCLLSGLRISHECHFFLRYSCWILLSVGDYLILMLSNGLCLALQTLQVLLLFKVFCIPFSQSPHCIIWSCTTILFQFLQLCWVVWQFGHWMCLCPTKNNHDSDDRFHLLAYNNV